MRRASGSMAMTVVAAALALLPAAGSLAAQHQSGGSGHGQMGAPAGKAAPEGVVIRTASVEGYALTYTLLNWSERNAAMKGMEGMEMAGMDSSGNSTHHLVLRLTGPDGKEVSGAKVGYQVTRPDGSEQKTLTMAMGGYGADLNHNARGSYTIRTKFVVGSATANDTFTYEVK